MTQNADHDSKSGMTFREIVGIMDTENRSKTAWFTNDQVAANRIIYTPSDFARNTLTHLQETGTLTAKTPHVSARTDLNSFLFFMVRSG